MAPRREDVERKVLEGMSKRWAKLASSSRVVPHAKAAGGTAQGPVSGYNSRVANFHDVPVPKFLLGKADDVKNFRVHAHVQATMFDTKGKVFFGNTWSSKGCDIRKATRGADTKWNGMPASVCTIDVSEHCSVYFASSASMAETKLVLELVMTVLDPTGTIRGEEYGICWAAVPMTVVASKDAAKFSIERDASELTKSHVYSGTPRLLLFGSDDKALDKAMVAKAEVKHVTLSASKLAGPALAMLVDNELIGSGEKVPGIARIDEPEPAEAATLSLSGIVVKVADGIEGRLIDYVNKTTGQKIEVAGFSLQLGIHNGRRFVGSKDPAVIKLTAYPGGRLKAGEAKSLESFIIAGAVSVVALLHADVKADGKDTKVCLGWCPISVCHPEGDAQGPVVVGDVKLDMRRSAPMISVSTSLVFADDGQTAPSLSAKVDKGKEASYKTVPLKELVDAEMAKVSGEEAEQAAPARAKESAEVKEKEADVQKLKSFKMVCDLTPLGKKGQTFIELESVDMEGTHADLMKRLCTAISEEPGLRMEYIGKGGEKIMVSSPGAYDNMLDLLESDWSGPKKLKGEMNVKVFHPEGYVKKEETFINADKPKEPAKEAEKKDAPAAEKEKKKPLSEIELVCDASGLEGGAKVEKVGAISVECSWKEASSKLRARFKQEVTLERPDNSKVDSAVSWKKLVQELEDDWMLEAPKLKGSAPVTVIAALKDQAAPTPTPTPPPAKPKAEEATKRETPAPPKPEPAAPPAAKKVESVSKAASGLAPLAPVSAKPTPPAPAAAPLPPPAAVVTASKENEAPAPVAVGAVVAVEERRKRGGMHGKRVTEQHPPRPRDAVLREGADTSVAHPRLPLAACALPMSRGLKARLLTACVSDVLPKFWRDVPFTEAGDELEPLDPPSSANLTAHTIILSFLAIQAPPSVHNVYLTLSFYHLEPLRTRTARLRREPGDPPSSPALLQEQGQDEGAGVTLTLTLDPDAAGGAGAGDAFDRYLATKGMQVHVWDADTCHQVGSMLVDLRGLRRKGRDAVQTAVQVPMLDPAAAASGEIEESRPVSSQTARPLLGVGVSGAARGSVFVRMVNVGRESSAPPSSKGGQGKPVRPLTEEAGVMQYEPVYAFGGGEGQGENRKAMSLVRAFRIKVEEEVAKAGGDGSRLTAEALKNAVLSAKLDLSVGQIDRISQQLSQQGLIDLSRLAMRGERVIAASAYQADMRQSLVQLCVTLLGTMVPKYGSSERAFEMFAESVVGAGGMGAAGLSSLISDVASVADLKASDQEIVALMRLMGSGIGGIPLSGFVGFFDVEYASSAEGSGVGLEGEGSEEARRRKMERWRRVKEVRHHREAGAKGVDERSLTIVAARLMREAHKTERITSFLEGCLNTSVEVAPSFGAPCFVVQPVANPFGEERVVSVVIGDDSGLEMVTERDELADIKRLSNLESSSADMRTASSPRQSNFLLAAHQEIHIPLRLRYESSAYLRAPGEAYTGADIDSQGGSASVPEEPRRFTSVVSATSVKEGMPLRVLSVNVKPAPYCADQTFLFYGARGDWIQKRIVLDVATAQAGLGWRSRPEQERAVEAAGLAGGAKHPWTDDRDVYVASRQHDGDKGLQEVEVAVRCGEAGTSRTFHVVLYNEKSRSSVYEIWRITVASLHSTDATGLLGQDTSLSLSVRGGDKAVSCRATSSHVSELSVEVDGAVMLGPSLTSVPLKFSPCASGWRDYIVNFVSERRLVSQWLVTAKARMPIITKRYDIRVEYGIVTYKKIMYINPSGVDRTYRLVSSHPSLLSFRMLRSEMAVPARGKQYINMKFTPGQKAAAGGRAVDRTEVYVFINDESGANEECLCIDVRAS